MLQTTNARRDSFVTDMDMIDTFEPVNLERILSASKRQKWIIGFCTFCGIVLGIFYIVLAVPLYTSSTDIFIDKGSAQIVDRLSQSSDTSTDDAAVMSQVELLKSEHMAREVVKLLNLTRDAEFQVQTSSLLSQIKQGLGDMFGAVKSIAFGGGSAGDEAGNQPSEAAIQRATGLLRSNLVVYRKDDTYVLSISFTSPSPTLAAKITSAYGEAYLNDQLEAKYDATKRAGSWLQERIAELRQQAYNADLAVQKFRNENNLITTGGDRLLSEQQLAEINSQLIAAKAGTAEAKARLDQIRALIESGRTDAVVDDALVSTTINNLRQKYLDASRRQSEIARKLGEDHIQATRLRTEMAEYERLIFGELRRIAEVYANNYTVAQSRENSLTESLSNIQQVNAGANTVQVELRELERQAATFRTLYNNFLQHYQETVQQQSFPVTEARIITPAEVPGRASFPKTPLVLALMAILGGGIGIAIGAYREYADSFFRTGEQIRSNLNMDFFGFTPLLAAENLTNSSVSRNAKAPEIGAGLWRTGSEYAYVQQNPMSPFTETLRNVKVAADLSRHDDEAKVIGVVSCLPSEGKSTICANLGLVLGMQGHRVLVIDGDLRNPGLTRSLSKIPERGIVELIADKEAKLNDHLQWDETGKVAVLPNVLSQRIMNMSDVIASQRMGQLLNHLRAHFDYIVIDLPPAGPVVDAKAFARYLDNYLFVVEWGRTPRRLVRNIMVNNPVFLEKTMGVILNKADDKRMELYRTEDTQEYYAHQYGGYYQTT